MHQDEKSLVEALHRGEKRACDDLVERYRDRIYSVALRLTGNPTEAEEILQETLISACRGAEAFEGRSSLTTWLHRIAVNNNLMRQRRNQLATVSIDSPEGEDGLPSLQLPDQAWNPEHVTLTDELYQKMDEAVGSLPQQLRSVFVLRDLHHLSTKEVAQTLNLSPGNVKVRLHRARQLLREQLAGYLEELPDQPLDE